MKVKSRVRSLTRDALGGRREVIVVRRQSVNSLQKRVPFSALKIGDKFQFSRGGKPRRFPESLEPSPEDSTVWVKVSLESYERTDHVVERDLRDVDSLVWWIPHQWERELPTDPHEKAEALYYRVELAYDAGKLLTAGEIASELLSTADRDRDGASYGNYVHRGHTICGLISMDSDDVEEAKRRLLLSGQIPGTPSLCSFGPSMALAQALVERGERDVVLNYLELCHRFWTHGQERLDRWVEQVQSLETPDFLPNVGY